MKRWMALGIIGVLSVGGWSLAWAAPDADSDNISATGQLESLQILPDAVEAITIPKTPQPQWYKDQLAAEQAAARAAVDAIRSAGSGRTVTYTVSTKGATKSNLAEFAAQANQTLNDGRGWAQLGLVFKQVPTGGSFNLILSQASLVPSFAPGACSAEWSCRVGVSVIINDDRWQGATVAWNSAGGGLRDYRHMVVNHEVGHWLGHGHANCSGAGSYAPVMLQQSIDLQGCKFNPWPLSSELWTSR